MSYHEKGAQHRAAELLEMKGIYLTKEQRRRIVVRRIPKENSVVENVYQVSDIDGCNTVFETTEVK